MPLEGPRHDAGFAQFLRRARGRREPFDPVARAFRFVTDGRESRRFSGASDTFQRHDLVAAGEDLRDGPALLFAQPMVALKVVGRHVAQW